MHPAASRTVTPLKTGQIARPVRRLLALRGRRCAASGRVAGWDSTPDPAQPVFHRRRLGFGRRLANGPKTVPDGTPYPSSVAVRWMPGSRAWGFSNAPSYNRSSRDRSRSAFAGGTRRGRPVPCSRSGGAYNLIGSFCQDWFAQRREGGVGFSQRAQRFRRDKEGVVRAAQPLLDSRFGLRSVWI